QATCVARIDKTQDFFVVLNGADKTLLLAHPATQPRQDRRENFTPPGSIQRLVFRASEGFGVPAFLLVSGFYVVGCFLDKRESQFITFLFVVRPVDESVLAENHSFRVRMLGTDALKSQTQLKAGSLPRRPDHFLAVNLLR